MISSLRCFFVVIFPGSRAESFSNIGKVHTVDKVQKGRNGPLWNGPNQL